MSDEAMQARRQLRDQLAAVVRSMNSLLKEMADRLHANDELDCAVSDALDYTAFEHFVRVSLDDVSRPLLGMGFLPNSALMPRAPIRWWYRRAVDEGVTLRPLPASTHPQAVDYYDPESTEWWEDAAASKAPIVSGPYVDISGTNAYVVTFAQAIRRRRDVVGVVAIDIRVSTLQAFCQDYLLDLPRPKSLINRNGIVIATNVGNLLGNVVDLPDAQADKVCQTVPGTPWFLYPAG